MDNGITRKSRSKNGDELADYLNRERQSQSSIPESAIEQALTEIGDCIKRSPDTSGGTQLRQFVWSLWNRERFVDLYSLSGTLDVGLRQHVETILVALCRGAFNEHHVRKVLESSGELVRWQHAREQTPIHAEVVYPPRSTTNFIRH